MEDISPKIRINDLLKYNYLGLKIKPEFAKKVKNDLTIKYGNLKNSSKMLKINYRTLMSIDKRCIRLYIWKKIFASLNQDIDLIEKYVIEIASKRIYPIILPYSVSPKLIRLASHIIGDGCMSRNSGIWIQKDVRPIMELQNSLMGFNSKINQLESSSQVPIENIYLKLVCNYLKINKLDLKNNKFIDKSIEVLPKEHKVQILAAILEDEGHIDPEGTAIKIAMSNKEIMNSVSKLLDNLGYDRSDIIETKNNGSFGNEKTKMYLVLLLILGAHKFYKDLQKSIEKEGNLLGLWTKQSKLEKLIQLNDGRNAKGRVRNNNFTPKIFDLVKKEKVITWNQVKKDLNISHSQTGSIINRMLRNKKLIRVSRGKYSLFETEPIH